LSAGKDACATPPVTDALRRGQNTIAPWLNSLATSPASFDGSLHFSLYKVSTFGRYAQDNASCFEMQAELCPSAKSYLRFTA
jgi:hypothetical protein